MSVRADWEVIHGVRKELTEKLIDGGEWMDDNETEYAWGTALEGSQGDGPGLWGTSYALIALKNLAGAELLASDEACRKMVGARRYLAGELSGAPDRRATMERHLDDIPRICASLEAASTVTLGGQPIRQRIEDLKASQVGAAGRFEGWPDSRYHALKNNPTFLATASALIVFRKDPNLYLERRIQGAASWLVGYLETKRNLGLAELAFGLTALSMLRYSPPGFDGLASQFLERVASTGSHLEGNVNVQLRYDKVVLRDSREETAKGAYNIDLPTCVYSAASFLRGVAAENPHLAGGIEFAEGGLRPILRDPIEYVTRPDRGMETEAAMRLSFALKQAERSLMYGDPMRTAPMVDSHQVGTVMFADIVDSTPAVSGLGNAAWSGVLSEFQALVTSEIQSFHGRHARPTGDGFLATFPEPGSAISCARAIRDNVTDRLGVHLRIGIHAGSYRTDQGELSGLAVHIANRVMSAAEPDQIVVTGTARDLLEGVNLVEFDALGEHKLKGVEGPRPLFAVRSTSGRPPSPQLKPR
ncbi:MAG: adenylate/guanylate cyclase domain-containing protein [Acidimicrobiia bacterium]